MTPAQFLARIKRKEIPPVCLFLGQEGYNRRRCREALVAAMSGVESEQYDASETSLTAIVDDARAMSLFASERLIFVIGAETAMPRSTRSASDDEDDETGSAGGLAAGLLEAYVKNPTPGVTLAFEATRWDLEGEDKPKTDRVRKFFGAIPDVVEFRRFTADDARGELDRIARAANLKLDPAAISQWTTERDRLKFRQTVSHDSYLINLASADDALWQKSIDLFVGELSRCLALGIPYLVTHPGAHMGTGEEAGLKRIANALDVVHDRAPADGVLTCLEITAGQGSSLGHKLEHLAAIIDQVKSPQRLGVCLDTAHLFAAGYDFRGHVRLLSVWDGRYTVIRDWCRAIGGRPPRRSVVLCSGAVVRP